MADKELDDYFTSLRGFAWALYLAGHGLTDSQERSGIIQLALAIEADINAAEKLHEANKRAAG
ncbi:MAG: hypothetical protein AB7F74_22725 [Parvibaculaceae bacterium]